MKETKFSGSTLFGIVLIAVGVISLLSALNYFDSWDIFATYWPLVIVLFGVKHMIDHRSSTVFGIILILLGGFLQLDRLDLWYFYNINVKELVVPVIIILIGLYFILPNSRKYEQKKMAEEDKGEKTKDKTGVTVEEPEKSATEDKADIEAEKVEAEVRDAEFTGGDGE